MKFPLALSRVAMFIVAVTLVGLVAEDASAWGWRRRCCRASYSNNCCYQNANYWGNGNCCGGGYYGGYYSGHGGYYSGNGGYYSGGYNTGVNTECCGANYDSNVPVVTSYGTRQPVPPAPAVAPEVNRSGQTQDTSDTDRVTDNPLPNPVNAASRIDRDRDEPRRN